MPSGPASASLGYATLHAPLSTAAVHLQDLSQHQSVTFSLEETPPRHVPLGGRRRPTTAHGRPHTRGSSCRRPNQDYHDIGHGHRQIQSCSGVIADGEDTQKETPSAQQSTAISSSSWLSSDEGLSPDSKSVLGIHQPVAPQPIIISRSTTPPHIKDVVATSEKRQQHPTTNNNAQPTLMSTPLPETPNNQTDSLLSQLDRQRITIDESFILLTDSIETRRKRKDMLIRAIWQFIVNYRRSITELSLNARPHDDHSSSRRGHSCGVGGGSNIRIVGGTIPKAVMNTNTSSTINPTTRAVAALSSSVVAATRRPVQKHPHPHPPVMCSSRAVYRELISARKAEKELHQLEATMEDVPLGSLPCGSFVVAKAVLEASTVIVFLRSLRYQSRMAYELSNIAEERFQYFRKRRTFETLRAITQYGKTRRKQLFNNVVFILMKGIVQRREVRGIVRHYVTMFRQRHDAVHSLHIVQRRRWFDFWYERMKNKRLSTTLFEYSKHNQSSTLLRLVNRPSKAVIAISSIMECMHKTSSHKTVKYSGATPLTLGAPPIHHNNYNDEASNFTSSSPVNMMMADHDIQKQGVQSRRHQSYLFPRDVVAKSASAPFSDPLQHTTDTHRLLIKRLAWTQWRHAFQNRRDVQEAGALYKSSLKASVFNQWKGRSSNIHTQSSYNTRQRPDALTDHSIPTQQQQQPSHPTPTIHTTAKLGMLATLTEAHLDRVADRMFQVRLLHSTYGMWKERHLTNTAIIHRRQHVQSSILELWRSKTYERRAHLRVKQFVFDHWKQKLENFRMRQIAHAWHRSSLAVRVIAKWQESAVVSSFRSNRVKRNIFVTWIEALKVRKAQKMLNEEKIRRHLVAWREVTLSHKNRRKQAVFAIAVNRQLQLLRCLNRWTSQWRGAVRGRMSMGIQDSMNSQKLVRGCFSKWHNRWAARMDAVAKHLVRERQQHLGMNISIGGDDEALANPTLSQTAYAQNLGIPQAPPETDTSILNTGNATDEQFYFHPASDEQQHHPHNTSHHSHMHRHQQSSLWALNTTGITTVPSQLNSSCHLCGSAVTDPHSRSGGGGGGASQKKPKKASRLAKSGGISRPIRSRGTSSKNKHRTVTHQRPLSVAPRPATTTSSSNVAAASPKAPFR